MMYKNIELDYLILCLDRLTRFKFTYDKYYRVFHDILNKYYSGDKKNISSDELISVVTEIFNASVNKYSPNSSSDKFFNHLLEFEERECFYQTQESEKFLSSNLNISGLIDAIKDNTDLPVNLKRLVKLESHREISPDALREEFALKFPLKKVVLSEGATEEILLCEFSKGSGYDFDKNGVELVGAGGKNQVAKKYYRMVEEIKLPIFILLDKDGMETKEFIMPKLRKKDKIYIINSGEFEDIISMKTIIGSVNSSFKNDLHINENDFNPDLSMVKNLKEIYRLKGFGHFNKANFAKNVKEYLSLNYDITKEMSYIVECIKEL